MRNVALAVAAVFALCLFLGDRNEVQLFQPAPLLRAPQGYYSATAPSAPYAYAATYPVNLGSQYVQYQPVAARTVQLPESDAGWLVAAGLTALGLVSFLSTRVASLAVAADAKPKSGGFDQEAFIAESKEMRLKHLEEQALYALKISCENFDHAVFPNAMIAGDVVITHLLGRLGYLKDGKCKVMVVDTFHLFPETMEFLKEIEDNYGFKAEVFCAEGIPVGDKAAYDARYGADLWKEDIEQYDKVCKVEPFQRGLKTLETNCMINGRTRWQGFERAWIDQFENAPIGGGLAKCNPLAYWTLEDCFDYINKYKIPHHPLHAQGYPSIGDAKDTIPIPEDKSVTFKNFEFQGDKTAWLDYASERKGRFVGLANKDGSTKIECGIHVEGAERTFDRDLWDADSKVKALATPEDVDAFVKAGPAVVAVYAPWCQFCQGMEEEYEKLAGQLKIPVAKFRGDEQREFVKSNLNTASFPTVNVVTADGKVVKYDSEDRSVADFAAFVEKTIA
jgi:phosphoadenosine phosphosulfate reductase